MAGSNIILVKKKKKKVGQLTRACLMLNAIVFSTGKFGGKKKYNKDIEIRLIVGKRLWTRKIGQRKGKKGGEKKKTINLKYCSRRTEK